MQVNEFNTGWFLKRYIISCTLVASDMETFETELKAVKLEIRHALDFHEHPCKKIQIVIASGQKSSREFRPVMKERLQTDAEIRAFAREVKIYGSFLTRMGDPMGKFRIRKS